MLNKNDNLNDLKEFLIQNDTLKNKSDKVWDSEKDDPLPFPDVSNNFKSHHPYPCENCKGKGKVFKLYRNGMTYTNTCKVCHGAGGFMTSPEDREKARQKRVDRKNAKAQKSYDAFKEAHGEEAFKYLFTQAYVEHSEFFKSLLDQLSKGRTLSEKQVGAITRSMAREEEYKVAKEKAKEPKASDIDLSEIITKLNGAINKGKLSKPKLTLMSSCEIPFTFTLAPEHGNNSGYVYVKKSREYFGKISPEGEFFGYKTPENELEALVNTITHSSEAVVRYGRVTGKCGVCSRQLTRKDSITRGIGPICADKYGF